ncbi:hypothetical protein JQX13_52025 [Archangium violaceum]|uniref:hypothetical protein n=1 Tax=Archangium violaceum TaxID=83451 RepID=UPI00193B1C7E|nr:hypothetical protein [Archangium violaceum]QRK08357.1 hypothetical protein JQX13_52025 [Archangium violaceum]
MLYLLHRVEDVTDFVRLSRRGEDSLFMQAPTAIAIFRGQVEAVIAVASDVTELVQARRRMEALAAEERLRLATEAMGMGTWEMDPTTGALEWDARMRALFLLTPGGVRTENGAAPATGMAPEKANSEGAGIQ